jgi:catechol 2,3-dioxygenase-like lactoylglutathione lyase family enzyme
MTFITGTDFVTISTADFDKAVDFYGGTLGLPELKRYGDLPGVEFETGNLTLAVLELEAFGQQHSPSRAPIACTSRAWKTRGRSSNRKA